jgi:hypothetical protein
VHREILGRVLLVALFLGICAFGIWSQRRECRGQCTHDRACQRLCLERNYCPVAMEDE